MTSAHIDRTLRQHPALPAHGPIVVAVSGGPDSLVLLHALHRGSHAAQLRVFHLDHGLRGSESAADAAFVAATATAWGIPVHCEHADIRTEAPEHPNLSEAARVVRYRRLAAYAHTSGAAAVLVAHTRDDQAETLLMRLLRGSGLRGLSAMAVATPWQLWAAPHHHAPDGPALVRPLLAIDRADIEQYVAHHQLTPRHDSSNTKTTALRVRVRQHYLPLLRGEQPQLNQILAATAAQLRSADDFIEQSLTTAWDSFATTDQHTVSIDPTGYAALHPALQTAALRRVIHHCVGSLRGYTDEHIAALHSAIHAGALIARPLPLGITLSWRNGCAVIHRPLTAPAAFALSAPTLLTPGVPVTLYAATLVSTLLPSGGVSSPLAVYIDPAPAYTLRTRRPGDVIAIGHGKHRRVQDVLLDAKIPAHQRADWPLLCAGEIVVWVVGVRLDPAFHRDIGATLHLAVRSTGSTPPDA